MTTNVGWISPASFLVLLLAISVIAGGGGAPAPLSELVVQAAACGIFAAAVFLFRADHASTAKDGIGWSVAGLVALAPTIQLLPLPPTIWQALPSRDLVSAALAATGADGGWRPISMFPDQTFAALLALIPSAAVLYLVARTSARDRGIVVLAIAALAVVSAVVGIVQVGSGDANWLRLYDYTHFGFATGFFANRNAQVDLLIIGMIAVIVSVVGVRSSSDDRRDSDRSGSWNAWAGLVIVLLAGSVIATGSRTGTMLLIVPLICGLHLYPSRSVSRPWWRGFTLQGAIALGVVALVWAALQFTALHSTLDRFGIVEEGRGTIWVNTRYAIDQYWPIGSGYGSFVPVYAFSEPLTAVSSTYINRAHNDWLETLLEGGLLSVGVLLVVAGLAATRITKRIRDPDRTVALQGWYVLYSLGVIALHSLVDYPLRTAALTVVATVSFGLLLNAPQHRAGTRRGSRRRSERVRRAVA